MWRVLGVLVGGLVACGGDSTVMPDGGALLDAPVDTGTTPFPACREFAGPRVPVPARITGSLAAADVESPQCAAVDAPFGVASAGPDTVIGLSGLTPGAAYVVLLESSADLAFYVATSCSTASGPSADECPLFVDASAGGEELGRFVATATTAFVIVDHYASSTPASQSFTLEVYGEACSTDAQCGGATPACQRGLCVECADSFDCGSVVAPRCDLATNLCVAGADACATDDAIEPLDDGPAGATALALDGSGHASATGQICSSPRSESDYYRFDVDTIGEVWDLSLAWTGARDLDLAVYTEDGDEIALSYWEQPETMRVTYLAPGRYFVRVRDFSASTAVPVAYRLDMQRTQGAGCTTRADCAASYRNQVFRGDCQGGACVTIDGAHSVAQGGACDSASDCTGNLSCPSFYFVADAASRNVCVPRCVSDAECGVLGAGYVCTTYLISNICVPTCTVDDHCPVSLDSEPVTGPWYRLRCQVATGRCVP